MTSDYHIVCTTWDRNSDQLGKIRRIVFVEEQGVPAEMEWDENDETAMHLLAMGPNQQPLGTARLLNTGQIGRIAVLKAHRNKGIARALLQKTVSLAIGNDYSSVFLHAQTPVIPFYESLGFKVSGRPFLEAEIEHYLMTKVLQGVTK